MCLPHYFSFENIDASMKSNRMMIVLMLF